jgi:hypothetical protein
MVGFGIFFNLRRTRQSTAAWSPADPWPAPTQPQIPLADARREVETIVAEGRFKVSATNAGGPQLPQLGPITREFFDRYPHLQSASGGTEIGNDLVTESTYIRGYISLGHSEDWDVVAKPGSDHIAVVEGSETKPAEIGVVFASIYHFIVAG